MYAWTEQPHHLLNPDAFLQACKVLQVKWLCMWPDVSMETCSGKSLRPRMRRYHGNWPRRLGAIWTPVVFSVQYHCAAVEPLKSKVVLPCTAFEWWAPQEILLIPGELHKEIFRASPGKVFGAIPSAHISPISTFRGCRWCSWKSKEPTVGDWEQTKVCFQAKESGSNWHCRDGGLMAYIYSLHWLNRSQMEDGVSSPNHAVMQYFEMLQLGEKKYSKSDQILQIFVYCYVRICMYSYIQLYIIYYILIDMICDVWRMTFDIKYIWVSISFWFI